MWAADVGDPIDYNIYGSAPFYRKCVLIAGHAYEGNGKSQCQMRKRLLMARPCPVDTRYYELDPSTGNLTLVTSNEANATVEYVSYSHGVYSRNAHAQEILLRPTDITWRLLGGSVDLYFYAGPTQPEVTTALQTSAIGLPALQQYFTFGFHQCRWGYANWSQLQEVVDNYEAFGIPLESIWVSCRSSVASACWH